MKTVFIFVPWFHPAYKAGGPIQSLANLLTQDDNEIFFRLFTSNRDLDNSIVAAKTDCWMTFNRRASVWHSSKGVTKDLLRMTENGLLFINGIYSWNYTLKPILFSKAKRKIVSVRGMLHPGALSQKSLKKTLYLNLWKALRIHKKIEFHASTIEEKEHIHIAFGNQVKVHVAANFPRVFKKQNLLEKHCDELQLTTVALISPMKNILLVLRALGATKAVVHYHIYGPVKDYGYWQQCKEFINQLPANITVTYHGDLHPTKVEEALQNGHVFILPSKSENFGHAIYEALTAGKPVITSCNTPWNNLQKIKAGYNVSTEDEQGLTKAIEAFAAMDKTELEAWSNGARTYAESAINIEEIREQYRAMFGLHNKNKQKTSLTEKAF